jgi:CubicO group peptidase (beta-lactamase class C family)
MGRLRSSTPSELRTTIAKTMAHNPEEPSTSTTQSTSTPNLAPQEHSLSESALLALFDRYVALLPESNGYIVNVLSPAKNIDLSVANGLSEVATNTKISAWQPSRIASVTKTFTAASILRLAEMKKLSLNDSIEQHSSSMLVEVLKSGGYDTSAITIKQLLQHSSGIADYAGNGEKYQGPFARAVSSNPLKKWTRVEQVEFAVKNYGPVAQPGQEFHYSDTGYILLGDIIEQVTKQSLAEALRSLVNYKKLGLASTYLEDSEPIPDLLLPQAHAYAGGVDISGVDASYDLFGGGGLVSSAQDVSKFFAALFNFSIFEHESTLDLMLGNGEPCLKGSGGEPAYMSLYPRTVGSETCFGHSGFTGITALYFPSLQASITFTVLQSNTSPSFQEDDLLKELVDMLSPSSTSANSANTSNSLDGLWRSDGYGYVLEIEGSRTTLYEETTISCLPVFETVRPAVRSTSKDTAALTFQGRVGCVILNRIDRLPETVAANSENDPVAAFDIFAATFSEHYPFFENRKLDWPSVTETHRLQVSASTTDQQLARIFADMLRPLGDAHTSVSVGDSMVFRGGRPGSAVAGYEEFGPFLERVMASTARYLGVELETWGNGLIAYAELPDAIGYLRFVAFDGFSETGRIDDDRDELTKALDGIFGGARVDELKGLIIDLRVNGGGSDELALQLAGHFTDVAYPAYSKLARNDTVNPEKFTSAQLISVQPSTGARFTGPIVVLTASLTVSAGETFTQALLNREPSPIRIGGNTQGVSSDVLQRHLPGCSVTFGLPNEDFMTEDGVSFDRFGIPPDICILTFSETELAEANDAAMDKARELIISGDAVNRTDLTKAPCSVC